MTDAEMAGLAEANVVQFAEMGFPRDKVVSRASLVVRYGGAGSKGDTYCLDRSRC